VHVGTGNYNPVTARLYEDVGLLTSDPRIGAEVGELFNYLTGFSRKKRYRSLIVAPHGMRDEMIALIKRETELSKPDKPGRIAMKLNSLVDPEVIDALYDASRKGVDIDLVVRGVCALRPGVAGLSERITVRSILGRFLEHSRIYYFQNGNKEKVYIGSADLMPRNLDNRVEVLVKVKSPKLKTALKETLDLAIADNSSAWQLNSDGSWNHAHRKADEAIVDFQAELIRQARAHA
jgi:polyphosphate kinase